VNFRRQGRRALLATVTVGIIAAGAILLQYAGRPPVDFRLPAEDICIVPPSGASPAHARDPASGLARYDARPIPVAARCPVCGMYPARFPNWAAQIIFLDGTAHFFDSPVDLFMFIDQADRFDALHTAADAAALYVADYRSGAWLDARSAAFVIGSAVRGPMRGPDLPAFADEVTARIFAGEHGGRVLRFDAIDRRTVATLRNATHAEHAH
jgi:copper chaperone NosL